MNLIFLGKQGVGKGTYASRLAERYKWPKISAGDLLREEIAKKSPMGREIESVINSGHLVKPEQISALIEKRIQEADCKNGFIFDGYPRSMEQVRLLEGMQKKLGMKIDLVVNFTASDKVLLERLTGRRTCRKCAAIYHIKNIPPKVPGICDKCGGELYQRDDDTEAAIRVRWEEYDRQTKPLIDYYEKKGMLAEIDASDEVDKIMPRVLEIIEKRMK
ncbi:MAG: adenylate kinase [Candidatus Diapherotrites archaeon]|nr:adenylate kinase [Candidatus Diapherotrites archaeon]